jgi:DNA mismatch repair protein MutS2
MEHALRVLEFDAVRKRLQVHCETSLGEELAGKLLPSFEAPEVWRGLDLTDCAYRLIGGHVPPSLGPVRDLRKAVFRAAKGSVLGGVEIFEAAETLAAMRAFRSFLSARRSEYELLWAHAEALPEAKVVEDRIMASLEPDGEVKNTASTELASLRRRKTSAQSRIIERIQSYCTGKSREYLSDPIYTVRDGRYVVPLQASYRGKIKGIVHDTSGTGQTLFIEPEDVLQLGNALREIEAAEREEVQRVLAELSGKLGSIARQFEDGVEAAGYLDFVLAKARLGYEDDGVVPDKAKGCSIEFSDGRHPLLDRAGVVPLTVTVGYDYDGLLITGPNTGGKTVAIKTIGLLMLMAQSGLMLPAKYARLGPFTQIWADIGDEQSIQQSLSTFSGHIRNIAEALHGLQEGALVLLDELGAGTDPAEGAALAKAILTALKVKGARLVASTHYGELKAFAYNTEGFQNAAMEFDAKSLRPTYRLIMGAPGASHALKIAERYGMPKELVEAARQGLSEEQQDVQLMMEKLEQSQRQARIAQGDADRRTADLRKLETQANKKLAEADEIRRTVYAKASGSIESTLREIRLEAATIFDELRKSVDPKALDAARKKLKDLQVLGEAFSDEFAVEPAQREPAEEIAKGMTIKVEGYTQIGTVLADPKGDTVLVQMGPLKLNVPLNDVRPTADRGEPKKAKPNLGLQRAMHASTEIHLRHQRAEEAMRMLEKFIDDAVLAGIPSVRIVHGKGEGILRKLTQDFLRKHPDVAQVRDAAPAEGGQGVTIAVFR